VETRQLRQRQAETKDNSQAEIRMETKAEIRVETKAVTRVETKTEIRVETKAEIRVETKDNNLHLIHFLQVIGGDAQAARLYHLHRQPHQVRKQIECQQQLKTPQKLRGN